MNLANPNNPVVSVNGAGSTSTGTSSNGSGRPQATEPHRDAPSGIASPDPVRIRKYPNRRLYDTSRSRHLTHDGVIALVQEGRTVQVTDSRSGADITNIVLLQIIIERDPSKLQALPTALVLRAMRSEPAALRTLGDIALQSWRGGASAPAPAPAAKVETPNRPVTSLPSRVPPAAPTSSPADSNGRPKAKAKRLDL